MRTSAQPADEWGAILKQPGASSKAPIIAAAFGAAYGFYIYVHWVRIMIQRDQPVRHMLLLLVFPIGMTAAAYFGVRVALNVKASMRK